MTAPRTPRRAPDLLAQETGVGAWFAGCSRAAPRALALGEVAAGPGSGRSAPFRGTALAALFALGLAASASTRGAPPPPAVPAPSSVLVLDDPSVPLFHALETFDEVGLLARAGDAGGGAR